MTLGYRLFFQSLSVESSPPDGEVLNFMMLAESGGSYVERYALMESGPELLERVRRP